MANVGDMDVLNPIDYGHPLARGLVGCWIAPGPLSGGNKLYDLSPYHNHGTLEASMTSSDWAPAQHGRGFGLDYDGGDDCITIADDMALDISNAITIAFYINLDSAGAPDGSTADVFVRKSPADLQWQIANLGGSDLAFDIVIEGTFNRLRPSLGTISTGAWHLIAATCAPGQTNGQKIYVDGEVFAERTPNGGTIDTDNKPLRIGGGSDWPIDGKIASPLIYSRALSAAEIRWLYIAGKTGDYPFLRSRMLYYGMWNRPSIVSLSWTASTSTDRHHTAIYHNNGSGSVRLDGSPQDTVTGTSWSIDSPADAEWVFLTRAVDGGDNEEANLDQMARVGLSAGSQIQRPNQPTIMDSRAVSGGEVELDVFYSREDEDGTASDINLYVNDGAGGSVDYHSAVGTTSLGDADYQFVTVTSSGLSGGKTYLCGVRAATSGGIEDENTDTVSVTTDAAAPDAPTLSGEII